MVNLTRIYTRTGDQGQTRLANNESVPKTDPRLSAYGTVDEANSALGWALAVPDIDPGMADVLTRVQNDLFDAGADLATPLDASSDRPALRVEQAWVDRLEDWCDTFGEDLPSLRSFLLPGGTELSARLNIVRTIVRRAEREAWAAGEETSVNPLALQYLNRLSDLLFILGRHANRLAGVDEVLWVPAGDHA
ncbi:MAG: cob(I)yrinic acid a,c-diamide adenosyltransferase [Propionibacteriaceae bacterium]|jgi:cob(I)alamin adenosyltransferase|nr:cob(I)yrinic acid a,c-diamide adenosyltransferase [Propionibacteriaceae bacterium]